MFLLQRSASTILVIGVSGMERFFITFSFSMSTTVGPCPYSLVKRLAFTSMLYSDYASWVPAASPLSSHRSRLCPTPKLALTPPSTPAPSPPFTHPPSKSTSSALPPPLRTRSLYIKNVRAPASPIREAPQTDKHSTNFTQLPNVPPQPF
ncbi:hypothetical protein HOY82DRAFT_614386 [Tuber indicum]|nr:hypothetical protein HOY82DRAFT_614386 [Tuber indicum]